MLDMLDRFARKYSDRRYRHPAMVRHKGSVIAFAMDESRRLCYAVLGDAGAPAAPPANAAGSAASSAFDVDNWPNAPAELVFPAEITEVGFGIADQRRLPVHKKNQRKPETTATYVAPDQRDLFLSTTARFTGDAPFQVLSDGRFVYVFRQAIDAQHADNVAVDAAGRLLTRVDAGTADFVPVDPPGADQRIDAVVTPIVDATMLVDRFVLVGSRLVPKLEVRFQRSRSKTRPANEKDGLGPKDLDGNDFLEPTQELRFIGNLRDGHFCVMLLPTRIPDVERWQFFTHNRLTGLIDAINVERAGDGLFNTRGSQIYTCVDHPEVFARQAGRCPESSVVDPAQVCDKPLVARVSESGHAECALRLDGERSRLNLAVPEPTAAGWTFEAWLRAEAAEGVAPRCVFGVDAAGRSAGTSLWIEAQNRLRLRLARGAGAIEFGSRSVLTPGEWNHVAVSVDGANVRFIVDGRLADQVPIDEPSPAVVATTSASRCFKGDIDEIRCWTRACPAREIAARLHQRLTGLEPGLTAYWRCDEGAGGDVFDQTTHARNATITDGVWITSDAPIGDNPGISRESFAIIDAATGEARSPSTGLSALLYFQQTPVASGYDRAEKPLKHSARVMLAFGTLGASGGKPFVAAIDLGVSSLGRLAGMPDRLPLTRVTATKTDTTSTPAGLESGATATMHHVHLDAQGLTVSGGLLEFAWTDDAPLLFDSALGTIALYFRGVDGQFFSAYYTTLTTSARYPLAERHDPSGAASAAVLTAVARSTDIGMDKLELEVGGDEASAFCTLTVSGLGMLETWRRLPRDPWRMARVLNGAAGREGAQGRRIGYRERIGAGVVVTDATGTSIELGEGLRLEQPWRTELEVDACLMLGEARARVAAAAARGAKRIAVAFDDAAPLGAPLPIYLLEYDYAQDAATTKVPGDLFGGSLLVRADTAMTAPGLRKVGNQRVRSGSTLRSNWSAERPGNTLVLDGKSQYAELAEPASVGKLEGWRNLTIEAWVRPTGIADSTPVVDKGGGKGSFGLRLERLPALEFDGKDDYVTLAHTAPLPTESSLTLEAWIRPVRFDGVRTIVAHGYPNTHDAKKAELFLRIENGQYQFGRWSNKGVIAKASVPAEDRSGTGWVHLAGVYDAASGTWSVVRNGLVLNSVKKAPAALDAVGDWGIGGNPDPAANAERRLFVGGIGDVRVWSKARKPAEIAADMVRRLEGSEPGLAANWHLGAKEARDIGAKKLHGKLHGKPLPATAFCVAAGLDGVFVRSNEIYLPGKWMHIAAVMVRDQGVHFDGQGASIDAGRDATLNVSGDLTIEINVRLDHLSTAHALLCKGRFNDGAAGQVPYALSVDPAGVLVFAFEDADGAVHSFRSTHRLVAARPQQIAVIRQSQTRSATALKEVKNPEDSSIETVSDTETITWSDVIFVIDGAAASAQRYAGADAGGAIDVLLAGGRPPSIRAAASGRQLSAPRIGTHTGSLTLGKLASVASEPLYLAGTLCEVRIWGRALSLAELDKPVARDAEGLVSRWRFDEQASAKTRDDVLGVEVVIGAGLAWSIDTAPERARLTLYCNGGEPLRCTSFRQALPTSGAGHFRLGASIGDSGGFFGGELAEVRVWHTARTREQIEDNMFRRLTGEVEELLACYQFKAGGDARIGDESGRGLDLLAHGGFTPKTSTAPIGEDIPRIRSALAGVRTGFNGPLDSRPSVQEYGDLQLDATGMPIGVFKRCYGYVLDGVWHLVTGFKVGDLSTDWIGQIQTAPQLKGYIEGAPPVPGENLTQRSVELIGDLDDYNDASRIAFVQADEANTTYSASKHESFDVETEIGFQFGYGVDVSAGFGVISKITEGKALLGFKGRFDASSGWLESASGSLTTLRQRETSVELRGHYTTPEEARSEPFGRRFVPDNIGLALVESSTADVFALRLKHNKALVSFSMLPNPDIPPDRNLISFPINPRYVKQGTLDGKIGPIADIDYPHALNASRDSSYFKPVEAYKLKRSIEQEQARIDLHYANFNAADEGRAVFPRHDTVAALAGVDTDTSKPDGAAAVRRLRRRNLANTYVWSSDGGMYAETEQALEVWSDTLSGDYAFKGMGGAEIDYAFKAGVASVFHLSAMLGGHIRREVTQSRQSTHGFQVHVSLDRVERDIYERAPGDASVVVTDTDGDGRVWPRKRPYKVDAYRFMTFCLGEDKAHTDTFFNAVVDPVWLAQSDAPAAVALRSARENKDTLAWRIFHRVTFVSRVLPAFGEAPPASLEQTLRTLEIDSNYELIKAIEPYVAGRLGSYAEFGRAVNEVLERNLPELRDHADRIVREMALYFGIAADPAGDSGIGDEPTADLPPNQPPIVNAGPDQVFALGGGEPKATLEAVVIDDRLERTEDIFVTWELMRGEGTWEHVLGGDGRRSKRFDFDANRVKFDDVHSPTTRVSFACCGRYVFRLTASDGLLTGRDDVVVVVNERPVVSAGPDIQAGTLEARLAGTIVDTGLGDPARGVVTVGWSRKSLHGKVVFESPKALGTKASFERAGNYLLRLEANNGSFSADDEVMVAVAARSTEGLLALYTFEEADGPLLRDVAGRSAAFDLVATPASALKRVPGGASVGADGTIRSAAAPIAWVDDIRASNAFSVELWLDAAPTSGGEARHMVTLGGEFGARDFVVGQKGRAIYFGARTSSADDGATDRALAGGALRKGGLTHVVCTRDANGLMRLFVGGHEVARRSVGGDLTAWRRDAVLVLGNDPDAVARGGRQGWPGTFRLLALFDRALGPGEVERHFAAGADADLPPRVRAGESRILEWLDAQQPTLAFALEGRIVHDRPTAVGTSEWLQIAGPGTGTADGVTFADRGDPRTVAQFPAKGRYLLRLSADDGQSMSSDEVEISVVTAPRVTLRNAPNDGSALRASLAGGRVPLSLAAVLDDSGLPEEPAAGSIGYRWALQNGPAAPEIERADQAECRVLFGARGIYVFALDVGNGHARLTSRLLTTVIVSEAPRVRVSGDSTVLLARPAPDAAAASQVQVELAGELTHSGCGSPTDTLTLSWSVIDGPEGAGVTITEPGAAHTTATFDAPGVYLLRFTASHDADPGLSASADMRITVHHAPLVDAGAEQQITLPAYAAVEGLVIDDGLPHPPGAAQLQWSRAAGGTALAFTSPAAVATTVRFGASGEYVLRLSARDAPDAPAVFGDVRIKVLPSRRVTEGLQALYVFQEGEGDAAYDTASFDAPLDLTLGDAGGARWLRDGLRIDAPASLIKRRPKRLLDAVAASGEITLEAWIRTDAQRLSTSHPGCIVMAANNGRRGFALAQVKDEVFQVRLRSGRDGPRRSAAERLVAEAEFVPGLCHLVFTSDRRGHVRYFVNGADHAAAAGTASRSASRAARNTRVDHPFDWPDDASLMLGNDAGGGAPWLGAYHLVAVYDRVLGDDEVAQNHAAGI